MNYKCILGFHDWQKFMGLRNIGKGKFKQVYRCKRCKKSKIIIK